MLTVRFLYLIGFVVMSALPAWAQAATGDTDNKPEIETEVQTDTPTDCVENKTCQKVQSEDDKQKAQQGPAEVVEPPETAEDEVQPET